MQKNLMSFIAFSLLVIVGWSYLQRVLWPIPPADGKKQAIAQKKDTPKIDEDPKKVVKVDDPKEKTDIPAPGDKKDDKKEDKKADPIPAPKTASEYALGDEKSFLRVLVSSRGAGVQKLTLSRFQAANFLGQPADRELDYVQDDPISPSFRMYHYPDVTLGTNPNVQLSDALWNLVGEGVEKDGEGWKISLWTLVPDQRNLKITKTYRLQPTDYHVGLSIEIQNVDPAAGKSTFRYQLAGAHGLPIEGEWYTPPTSIRSSVVGVVDSRGNLARTFEDSARIANKKPEDQLIGLGEKVVAGDSWIQYAGIMTQYFASVIVVDPKQTSGDWNKQPSLLQWARPTQESIEVKATIVTVLGDSIIFRDAKGERFFGRLLPRAAEHLKTLNLTEGSTCVVNYYPEIGPPTIEGTKVVVSWFRRGQTPLAYFDDITVRVSSDIVNVPVNEKVTHKFLLYHGPVKTRLLAQLPGDSRVAADLVEKYTYTLNLRTLTDYHSDTSIGWFFSKIGWTDLLIFCTNLMHSLLYWLHYPAFGNWGLSVIFLTLVVRGAMYPISRRQALMGQKMQLLAPEIKKLQEKHKGDKAAQAQATMELYRKHKVSPAGGCLPLLLQMPIFMGLYYCLQESVQFRLATFLWIENLAAPDMLFWWGERVPWINDPNSLGSMFYLGPFFNLLPVLAAGFMIVQQKILMPPPQNEEQEVQQKTMQIMMGVMGIFFFKVAAGLCLYFIASSVWGVLERKLLPKKTLATVDAAPVETVKVMSSRDRRKERERAKADPEPETTMDKIKEWWRKLLESAEKK